MIAWYLRVFEARVQHRGDRLARSSPTTTSITASPS
jgi:hypothetical protein